MRIFKAYKINENFEFIVQSIYYINLSQQFIISFHQNLGQENYVLRRN